MIKFIGNLHSDTQLCQLFSLASRGFITGSQEFSLFLLLLRHYYAGVFLSKNFPEYADYNCQLICQAVLLKIECLSDLENEVFATDVEESEEEDNNKGSPTVRESRKRSEKLANEKNGTKKEEASPDDPHFKEMELSDDSNVASSNGQTKQDDVKVHDPSVKIVTGTQMDTNATTSDEDVIEVDSSDAEVPEEEDLVEIFKNLRPEEKRKFLRAQQGTIPKTPRAVNAATNNITHPTTPNIKIKPEPGTNSSGKRKPNNDGKSDSGKKKQKFPFKHPRKPQNSK